MEFFGAFVSKLEDAERSFVAIDGFLVIVCAPRRCLKTPDRLIVLCKIDIKRALVNRWVKGIRRRP